MQDIHPVAEAAASGAPSGQVGPRFGPSPALKAGEEAPAESQPHISHTADLSVQASSAADLATVTHQDVQAEAEERLLLQRQVSHGNATTSGAAQNISNYSSSSSKPTSQVGLVSFTCSHIRATISLPPYLQGCMHITLMSLRIISLVFLT